MMYSKKKKGFSLAELLISLLIISIVLAAAIPTITKRNAAGSEKIWHWSEHNNSVYSAVGSNQSVIIGNEVSPFKDEENSGSYLSNFFQDSSIFDNPESFSSHFTTDGDKLVLYKKSLTGSNGQSISNLANSHISFYTLRYTSTSTPADIHYAGRLAADKYNLALGIGSLQSFNTTESGSTTEGTIGGYNTALGHHTLTYNQKGLYNTAVGEKSIARNTIGSDNTAVGYSSLMKLTANSANNLDYSGNTAIGSLSLTDFQKGYGNTAIGYNSQFGTTEGYYNTAIGVDACSYVKGNYNLCLGYGAGASPQAPKLNPGTAYERWTETEKDYSLNIGVARAIADSNSVYATTHDTPIITGVLQAYKNGSETIDKYLGVNARIFSVNTFNGSKPIFYARSKMVSNADTSSGYATSNAATIGDFFFNLRDTSGGDSSSLLLSLAGTSDTAGNDKKVIINAFDTYHPTASNSYADFKINNRFTLGFDDGVISFSSKHADSSGDTQYNTFNIDDFARIRSAMSSGTVYQSFELGDTKRQHPLATNESVYDITFNKNTKTMYTNINRKLDYVGNDYQVKTNYYKLIGGNTALEMGGSSNVFKVTAAELLYTPSAAFKDGTTQLGLGDFYNQYLDFKELVFGMFQQHFATSDARLKNISGDSKAGLKEINALEVKNYTYKKDEKKTPHVGVIAQQLQKIFPNSVFEDADGYLKIRTEEIFYAMVNSIKELFAMVQDLTAKVTGLDKRITELEQQNKLLKEQNEAFEKRLAKLEKQAAK